MFPTVHISYSTFDFDINSAWIVLAIIWLPELIAVIEWGLFFSVFALAALGAAMFLDFTYFSNIEILPKIGPTSLIMIVMILFSVRYFSNYSLNEIKHFRKYRPLRIVISIAEASFSCIGGILIWKYFLTTRFYKKKLTRILDKIETVTAAVQVITIIAVSFIQFPIVPLWLQVIIIISAPVGLISISILLIKNRWYAWKTVFEIYTEEFSSQVLTIFKTVTETPGVDKIKYLPIIYWALIGNWFTIAIALYDIFTVLYNIIPDLAVVIPLLGILALKYVSSMIYATKIILSYRVTR